ncbi:MAG: ABC transporter permease [Spirochaetales bacterium]|nr:ABC transporter permease [Spirochaetales bacterium]
MIRYIIRRMLWVIPTVLVVSFLVYVAMDLTPGDPANAVLGDVATDEQYNQVREEMGLNDPIVVRYFRYVVNAVQGDLGTTLYGKRSVWDEVMSRLPYTIYLTLASIVVAVIFSLPLGILAGIRQNTWIDTLASVFSFVGMAIPNFWLGILLIMAFSVHLGWLPSMGVHGFKSIILPAITVGTGLTASLTRTVRAAMLDVIRQDYLRTARAKGLSNRVVILKHALKNAMIPIVTIIGTNMAGLLAGAMVTETVFSWPGIGYLTIKSVLGGDYNLVTGCIIITAVLMSLILLLIDVIYGFVDPRIKAQYVEGR